jgi:hypothetical protein
LIATKLLVSTQQQTVLNLPVDSKQEQPHHDARVKISAEERASVGPEGNQGLAKEIYEDGGGEVKVGDPTEILSRYRQPLFEGEGDEKEAGGSSNPPENEEARNGDNVV